MSVAATKRRAAMRPGAPKPQKPAPKVVVPSGLCTTCNRVRNCSYIRNPGQPVLFCEEFDCYTPPVIEEQPAEVQAPTAEDMKQWDEYKGLCVNCDSRENCAIRNSEIGVWHCEEYQ